jgi:hypothetical protein
MRKRLPSCRLLCTAVGFRCTVVRWWCRSSTHRSPGPAGRCRGHARGRRVVRCGMQPSVDLSLVFSACTSLILWNSHADATVLCLLTQVTCVYLFHELPAAVRCKAAAEMARVCKPGGMVVSMCTSMAPRETLVSRKLFIEVSGCSPRALEGIVRQIACITKYSRAMHSALALAGFHRQRADGRPGGVRPPAGPVW